MKKNLATVPWGIQHYKSYTLRLSTVFLFLVFCNLQLSAVLTDSTTTSQDQTAVIYISSGAQITGASEFSNAQIIELPNKLGPKKVTQKKTAKSALEEFDAKSESLSRKAKSFQEKNNRKITTFYASNPMNTERVRLAKSWLTSAAVSVNLPVHFSKAILSLASSQFIAFEKFKPNFYHFRSYFESRKFTSASLRGPPGQPRITC